MEALTFTTGTKRSHDGNPVRTELPPDPSTLPSMPGEIRQPQRATSPALSTSSSSLSEISSMTNRSQQPANSARSPAKKPKLTFAEREIDKAVKTREKEERARRKADEKAKREQERRIKDIEKAKRDAEKAEARRIKQDEKAQRDADRTAKEQAREEEKRAKEAEKLKKERAQMRIGTFFGRPAPASTPPSTPDDVSGVSSRRSSVASIDMTAPVLDTKPASSHPEFYKWLLPFFPHDHTQVAPHNRFLASGKSLPLCVDLPTQYPSATSQPLNQRFGRRRRKVRSVVPVKTLISLMSGSEQSPVDLTAESVVDEACLLLGKTRYKILSFREDVRPPYQGTYTRPVSPRSSRKLSRRPTARALPDTNYDYDSEAEWQAPEEGDEDLEEDDVLSEDEADADEMDDFLDDENDTSKRKLMTADVEPLSTGLCWEGEKDLSGLGLDITAYRLDVVHDDTRFPINPYSSDHWSLIGKSTPLKAIPALVADMQPPRLPLAALSVPNGSPLRSFIKSVRVDEGKGQKENASPRPQKSKLPKTDKPVKVIPEDLLPAFKTAISGSDLNKVALVEILKKQFPGCPKDAIKSTLETVAVRQGKKEIDKRWVLVA